MKNLYFIPLTGRQHQSLCTYLVWILLDGSIKLVLTLKKDCRILNVCRTRFFRAWEYSECSPKLFFKFNLSLHLGTVQNLSDRQDAMMTMMVRIHEAVKSRRTDDNELPFISSREELDAFNEKLTDAGERKKMVSIFYIVLKGFWKLNYYSLLSKEKKIMSAKYNMKWFQNLFYRFL